MNRLIALVLLLFVATACTFPGDNRLGVNLKTHLSNLPESTPLAAPPRPVTLPSDDSPHDALTEWWYYTGHLTASNGDRYGFEFVVFQSHRNDTPPAYASHFAVTDHQRQTFQHQEKMAFGSMPSSDHMFNFVFDDWQMSGGDGRDFLSATMPGYGIDLTLQSLKPPALHNRVGWISFGPVGDSYYYSRTRLDVKGTLTDGGTSREVEGIAWFDHQWGNFISVFGSGWDWFSIQLDDQSDLTISIVRDLDGHVAGAYGSYITPGGEVIHLPASDFTVEPISRWQSPTTGIIYPSGWTIMLPHDDLELTLTPVIPDQELDTQQSTGVDYWEGENIVSGTKAGQPIHGLAYVELTGYR